MKTRGPRFIRRGIYAAWALAVLAGFLTTLLTPSTPPRVTLTAADSSISPSALTAKQQVQAGRPRDDLVPWGSGYLSTFMQEYRIRHNVSGYRNVAALEQLSPNGDRVVVVVASAGQQVKGRDIPFDVYINGEYKWTINRYVYTKQRWFKEENFHAEMLLRRFFEDQVITEKYLGEKTINPLRIIDGESELEPCGTCEAMLESTFKNLRLKYNFIYNRHIAKNAVRRLSRRIEKWVKNGRLVTRAGLPRGPGSRNKIAQGTLAVASELGLPCPKPESLGRSSANGGSGMKLVAFSSSDPCGEGEVAPGGITKALTSGNLGGVDFSTLQLRYMSDNPDSTGLQYSFSGQRDTSAAPQDIGTALNVLTDNAADLRTWLVLNPDEFWVNLNPSEPDRIIAPQLGETNAGRELLDADLQLKRSSATLLNPKTKLGAQYWQDLAGGSSSVCYGSRMWIVPGQVQVREDGGSLYILKAQLAVKAVPDHVADMPATCHYTPQSDARGQRLDQTMIVPLITKMVNTARVYAPIRRAFMARIVAQWIRDRHASGEHTSFDHLINSGNIGPATLQDGWKPRQVYDAYLKSLKDGEFTYTTTVHQGGATYLQKITVGGVDFTHLNPATISAAQMNQDYPQLPQTAKSSVTQITSSGGSLWLGDTIAPATGSMRSSPGDLIRSLTSGRTGILILVLAALAMVIFGIRRGSRRGRQTT